VPKKTAPKPATTPRTLMYEFTNILDAGIAFQANHEKKKYYCEDGEQVELPVKYAKALNNIKFVFPHVFIDDDGNRQRKKVVKRRFTFVPVEVL
jgi:hypothetical protein